MGRRLTIQATAGLMPKVEMGGMLNQLPETGVKIGIWYPPYNGAYSLDGRPLFRAEPGGILVLQLSPSGEADPRRIRGWIETARAEGYAVAVGYPAGGAEGVMGLVMQAATWGVSAAVASDADLVHEVRRGTLALDVVGHWLSWIRLYRALTAEVEQALSCLLAEGLEGRSYLRALDALGIGATTLRRRLRAHQIPAPHVWHRAAWLLGHRRRLERARVAGCEIDVAAYAIQVCNYSEKKALDTAFWRMVGLTSGPILARPGLEWWYGRSTPLRP